MSIRLWRVRRSADDTPAVAVNDLLKCLGISATLSHVRNTLSGHPDYPSLLSLAESLPEWGVHAEGVKGTIGDLSDVDFPSIVMLENGKHSQTFAVLENMMDSVVTINHPADGHQTLSLKDFGKLWSGVLLRTTPSENGFERDFVRHRKEERFAFAKRMVIMLGLPLLFLMAFAYGIAHVESPGMLIPLVLVKICGFAVCGVMVADTLGGSNLMSSLCPTGRVINCHRVMRSPAGKLFGISMSDWGLLYFGGSLLSLLAALYFGQFRNDLMLLGILGLFTLPYTVFSVVYQTFVIRSWCWMCLVVMGLFWAEFYLMYDILQQFVGTGFSGIVFPMSILIGFGAAVVGWASLKHIIQSAGKAGSLEQQLTRLRRQPEYIHYQLSKTGNSEMGHFPIEVEIGPKDAKLTISAVVNPLCGHCWQAFNHLDQLISLGMGQVKGTIRFLVTPNRDEEAPTKAEEFLDREVSLRILAYAVNGRRELVHKALTDWFSPNDTLSTGKFDRWQQRYHDIDEVTRRTAVGVLDQQMQWARSHEIIGTPTLYFNGHRLPYGLQLEDLKLYVMRLLSG